MTVSITRLTLARLNMLSSNQRQLRRFLRTNFLQLPLRRGLSKSCTAPSGEVNEVLTVQVGEMYRWVDWSNESKVPCSREQQQQ